MEEHTLPRDEAVVEETAPAEAVEVQPAPEAEAEAVIHEAAAEHAAGTDDAPAAEPEAAPAEDAAPTAEEQPAEQQSFPEPEPVEGEPAPAHEMPDTELKAILEGVVYVADEPLSPQQIAAALELPQPRVEAMLAQLVEEYARPERGLSIKEVAGGYKMSTKAEHHEAIRRFVKNLKAPFKLSLAALETLAVIAYKQPITAPEIMEIRGVQGAGVLKTLLDRKLITTAGRKSVVGKPILYKTTKDFLVQFGLKDLAELPTLKEFEELRRLALSDSDMPSGDSGESPVTSDPLPASAVIVEGVVAVEDIAAETAPSERAATEAPEAPAAVEAPAQAQAEEEAKQE